VWDVKYRPRTFSDVLGQGGTVQVLKSRLCKGTAMDTSYIFSGGHGRGKTTLARILGRALLCQDLQEDGEPCNECDNCEAILGETSMAFAELDAASRGTIDNVRHIVDDLDFITVGATKRIYVFDESHRMSRDAQDVLLKPLEDKRLVGIFCTTEPAKIRGTIRSRCEEYPIRKITREDILGRMRGVLEKESTGFNEDAVLTVIDHCGGHVRDVLNRLEMISQLGDVTLDVVREYLDLGLVSTYYQTLLALGRPAEAVALVEGACDRVGVEEVSAGLAEAAMNSYRLAHGMFAEFTYVDRELAEKVHGVYGDDVVRLAEYFLQRRVGKTGLICDIIRCAGGVPTPATEATQAPPVKVHACGPQPAPQAPPESPPTPEPQKSPEAAKPPPEPTAAPKPPPPATAPKAAPESKNMRDDGVGNLGSPDPLALTSDDTKGVPRQHPRGGQGKPEAPAKVRNKSNRADDLLTAEEWSREFLAALQVWGRGA
jgi:DNA polymerase III subunit gamma/tau